MSGETPFRITLFAGFVLLIAVMLPFRIRSWASGEKLDRRQEGLPVLISSRLAGLATWVALIVYVVSPARMGWSAMPLPSWSRWLGMILYAVTLGLLVWTLRSLGTNLTDTVVTRRDHTLVTHGPYRWVRHPFYGCVALFILSITLVAANWFFLLIGGLALGLLVIRTRIEEERLTARFGEAYRAYARDTGQFVPKWR